MIENTAIAMYQANYTYTNQVAYRADTNTVQDGAEQDSIFFTSDEVHLTYSSETVITYNKLMGLEGETPDPVELLRGMVMDVFEVQGLNSKITVGEEEIDFETLGPEEAGELIAEDGYFGVEKTSDRIVEFALGIAGGDPSRLDAILAGVEQGFQEAYDAFGGWLPDISYETYDAVMQKLDNWATESAGQL